MRSSAFRGIAIAVLLAAGAAASASDIGGANGLPEGLNNLIKQYPGVGYYQHGTQIVSIYGKPMNAGATPEIAAFSWLRDHLDAMGAGDVELRQAWSTPTGDGKFTAFGFDQFVGKVPVENGTFRLLVLNGPTNRVVYAGGNLAAIPSGGLAKAAVNGQQALSSVQKMNAYKGLVVWTAPEMVVLRHESEVVRTVRTWKFMGSSTAGVIPKRLSFFVDASTGKLLRVRDEILNIDVNGKIQGKGTPGTLPDIASNPPVVMDMPEVKAFIQGGGNAYTDRQGNYTIANGGGGQVTVTTKVGPAVGDGRWTWIDAQQGTEMSLSQVVTPPGPANFMYNDVPAQFNTSQVNAFIQTNNIHNYFKDRAPGFNNLDVSLRTNVNLTSTCNAHYDPDQQSINFYAAGGGCVNTAYSSVVAHEYGHFIVNRLGLGQGAFGEGYGDTSAVLLYDDPVVGKNFYNSGGFIRNVETANKQYPCNGAVHDCGQVVAGVWWDIRKNMGVTHGSGPGLDLTRQLAVSWSLITTGGLGTNSAHPQTAIEVLTTDDDDGDIGNGTPNYSEICAGFKKHNINCPEIKLLTFEYPNGKPSQLEPNTPTDIRVDVKPLNGTPLPDSGFIYYSIDGGSFVKVKMLQGNPNEYTGTIPGIDCTHKVNYYFQASATGGGTQTDPGDAPANSFSALSATGVNVAFEDNMESNKNWVSGAAGDNATTGKWNRMDPQTTIAQPGDDHSNPGTICWVTDGNAGSSDGDFDVDNGTTTLLTPVMDMSGLNGVSISYWRWYSNAAGGAPNADTFVVGISNDGGTTWKTVETVGPAGPETNGQWFFHEFDPSTFVSLTNQMRMRFVASDLATPSLIEAAVDDFKAVAIECSDACPADINGDGTLDIDDFIAFQTLFGLEDPKADFNDDGVFDIDDFIAFQTAFGIGC